MEEFFQYVGPTAAGEKLFLYAAPRENPIERCGEVPPGAYFASAGLSVRGAECWLKIRRGVFSNARLNGYVRVELAGDDVDDDDGDAAEDGALPPHQRTSTAVARPTRFKRLRCLPSFPTFLCARERLLVTRIPVFTAREHKKSFSSDDVPASSLPSSAAAPAKHQRFLPAVSVFHATECQFNDDFSQLALKVTSTFGMTGWVSASFHETLVVVEDPRPHEWPHPVYVQNVAPKSNKWKGELPVRATPSLQAPRIGSLAPFRIVEAVERKLVKDQVWLRVRNFRSPEQPAAPAALSASSSDGVGSQVAHATTAETGSADRQGAAAAEAAEEERLAASDAWVVERNVNSAERVIVPWGADCFRPELPNSDHTERFYRNVYSRRALPLRRRPELASEVVGYVEPGAVFASPTRVLNDQGHMWVRVPLLADSDENPQDAKQFGYAIQSNAKTNRCMLQEIPAPGKLSPKQFFQVTTTSHGASRGDSTTAPPRRTLAAHAEPSSTAKALFTVRTGAVVSVLGSLYVREERRMWLQVLAADIDISMRASVENVVLSAEEQQQNVVYLPVCDPSSPVDTVVRPIHVRQLERVPTTATAHSDEKKSAARVVFSGRASKLFGSQLMQPSTIDLDTRSVKKTKEVGIRSPAAAAAGETQAPPQDAAQALKDEINSWQLESEHLGVISTYVSNGLGQLGNCLKRPFGSCLAKKDAMRKYEQLYQQDEEEDDLEFGELRV